MTKKEAAFIKVVSDFYTKNGRRNLPWRKTTNPYHILVSELMLQQTQAARVIPKYQAFLKQFPSIKKLAAVSLGDVLRAWQGLGYNRRAKFLWHAANYIQTELGGIFPRDYETLRKLPGVGPYTAGAVMVFAFNRPLPLIETNIRTVFIHHFFAKKKKVDDKELLPIIERTLLKTNAREWFSALMDYGAFLKKTEGNQSMRSSQYRVQTKFSGSNREIRGALLRLLIAKDQGLESMLHQLSHFTAVRVRAQITALQNEGFIAINKNGQYSLS
ncbi:MAG: A/G-specific adenine glycosylase [Patescibacteria group bacterium]